MAGKGRKNPAESGAEKLRARVLVDHDGFKIDQVIEGKDAARGHKEGWADAHPDAVAYARKVASRAARAKAEDA